MKSSVIYEPAFKAWVPADQEEYILYDVAEPSRKSAIKKLWQERKNMALRVKLATKLLQAPIVKNQFGYYLSQQAVPNKASTWLYEFCEVDRPHFGEHKTEEEMKAVMASMKERIKLLSDVVG